MVGFRCLADHNRAIPDRNGTDRLNRSRPARAVSGPTPLGSYGVSPHIGWIGPPVRPVATGLRAPSSRWCRPPAAAPAESSGGTSPVARCRRSSVT